jgi:aldehyde:ferredoxin oxidoreductase
VQLIEFNKKIATLKKLMMRVANIDLANEKIADDVLGEDITRNYIGGNGLAIRQFSKRLKLGIAPFSTNDKRNLR